MADANVLLRAVVLFLIMIFFILSVIWSILLLRGRDYIYQYTFVAFGDSLTDFENQFKSTGNQVPDPNIYYKGRWSNGELWIETMSSSLDARLMDQAFGGATCDNSIVPGDPTTTDGANATTGFVPSVKEQVDTFLRNSTVSPLQTTFIIWIGSNDYQTILNNNMTNIQPSQIVDSIQSSIQRLTSTGAHKFLVLNIPPIQLTPRYSNATQKVRDNLQSLIKAHNLLLESMIKNITTDTGFGFAEVFDVHNLTSTMISDPGRYGFTNVVDSCIVRDEKDITRKCMNPDEYLFWDEVHPTERAHQLLANKTVDFLNQNKCIFSEICKR